MPLFRAAEGLRALVRLARRGSPPEPPLAPERRRLVLLQIDGLSSRRLREAVGRGEMPQLRRALDRGELVLRSMQSAGAPSTPVFQAGLLYGGRGGVPGFAWFDRALGRTVRMDLADDVEAVERSFGPRAPLLADGGVSYGTIWPGGAAHAFFNVVRFIYGRGASGRVVQNAWDRLLSTVAGAQIAGRVAARFVLELGVGLWDFVRWCRRIHTTRFEWRFLYMRLFVSVVMRDVSTQGAIVDILRGVPVIYVDYLGYDEYAHRRGPDSEMALYNLRGIDAAIGRIARALRAVPEHGYDLYVFSDHGQSATTPFEHVVGRDLHEFVLEHVSGDAAGSVESGLIRELVSLRATAIWSRTVPPPLRKILQRYVEWLRRRLQRRLEQHGRASLSAIEVVTGGTIAHLYFRELESPTVDEIAARWPALFRALVASPAVGILVGRSADGPVVIYRGARYRLDDRRALDELEPFRRLDYALLSRHLADAASSGRAGDLVLYSAFSEAGDVAYDFEFGSHGGIGPDELDQFVAHPARVAWTLPHAVTAEELYRFFRRRYLTGTGALRAA